MLVKINSLEGLKAINRHLDTIAVRVYRKGKWISAWLSECSPEEIMKYLIQWTEEGRNIESEC